MSQRLLFPAVAYLAWLVPAAVLLILAPAAKKRFDELGLAVPWATKLTFEIAPFWPVLAAIGFLAAAAVWATARVRPRAVWVVFAVVAVPGLVLGVAFGLGLALPEMQLAEGMSK